MVTQINAVTGQHDWEHQFDFTASPPSGFPYYQCCFAQGVDFPDGSNGDGLACVSPGLTEVNVCLMGPVGGSSPPQYTQCVSFPGVVGDRQGFTCDGPMITYRRQDPDGTGVLTSLINCNGVESPCTAITVEDNSLNIIASAFPPKVLQIQGVYYPLITDQTIAIDVTQSNTVNVSAVNLPMSFFNNETGNLTQYPNNVGGIP